MTVKEAIEENTKLKHGLMDAYNLVHFITEMLESGEGLDKDSIVSYVESITIEKGDNMRKAIKKMLSVCHEQQDAVMSMEVGEDILKEG